MATNSLQAGEVDQGWLAVIGRALAFLCLEHADLRDKGLVPQAQLLEKLGLSRREAAALLDTTDRSLTELYRQHRVRSGAKTRGKSQKAR